MIRMIKVMIVFLLLPVLLVAKPMSGTYTVGTLSDFANLNDAFSALLTNGVDGPVDLKIMNGKYRWGSSYLSGIIPGTSTTNTINISSYFGDPNTCVLEDSLGYSILQINNSAYVNVSYIGFKKLDTGSNNGIYLTGENHNISISLCNFNAAMGNNSGTAISVYNFSEGTTAKNINITNNIFYNGNIAIVLWGNSGGKINKCVIQENSLNNQYSSSITLSGVTDSILIYQNYLTSDSETGYYNGINTSCTSKSGLLINRNSIVGRTGVGIKFASGGDDPAIIINNMIKMGEAMALYLYYTKAVHVIHNTFVCTGTTTGNPVLYMQGSNSDIHIANNIITQLGGRKVFILISSQLSSFSYNRFYSSDIFYGAIDNLGYSILSSWQSVFPGFFNTCKEGQVTFQDTNNGNLHLSGTSIADVTLSAEKYTGYEIPTTDWDGTTRPEHPYMGAHEIFGAPLPVEMTTFNYLIKNEKIVLNWETKSETNNYGWEVEYRREGSKEEGKWKKIGFVAGRGTTTEKQTYSFEFSRSGKLIETRLKQIDSDGKYNFSNILVIEAEPETFEFLNNYPNPFNPTTEINYQLLVNGKVELKIFDLLGREVKTIVNEEKPAGKHSVRFDASGFSSGVYIYQLKSGNQVISKKMILSK